MGTRHTTTTAIQEKKVSFTLYLACVNCDFPLTVEATVFFADPEDGLKGADGCYLQRVAFGAATMKPQDLPAEMRAELTSAAISHAYDLLNAETVAAI
jgi:acyl-CoA thioesterase FadM